MSVEELIQQIIERAEDPVVKAEWDAHDREIREWGASELKAAKRNAADEIQLPGKDLGMLRAGLVRQTFPVLALTESHVLVVLSGLPGCGKTTASSSWLWSWVNDDANWMFDGFAPRLRGSALFVSAAKLSRWSRYNDAEMEKLLKANRVVIDDLGAEFIDLKGSFMALFDELANERYANGRPTVMTTNLDAAAFKARYGERIADRIRECGRFVSIGGASLRRKA